MSLSYSFRLIRPTFETSGCPGRLLSGLRRDQASWRAIGVMLLCSAYLLLCGSTKAGGLYRSSIAGELLHIRDAVSLIWIRGDYCGSIRMCEGVLYAGVDIRLKSGQVVRIDRLVLLHPETTDCARGDPYWAMLTVSEAFSPLKTGKIMGEIYSAIHVGPIRASKIELAPATDKRMGFAADGTAHVGRLTIIVDFAKPFPESLHLKSFCNDVVTGVMPILNKELVFR